MSFKKYLISMDNEKWYSGFIDWLLLASMLLLSIGAGLWYYKKSKYANVEEHLLGGKNLKLFPVSTSLIASFVSGITILGIPSEIYNFGTQYWLTIISVAVSSIIVSNVYLPVFLTLKLNSIYEYLELRFNRGVRILISLMFVFDMILYQSVVVYVPASALYQLSGINTLLIACIVCVTCVFYTVMGGFRAVIWIDTLQVLLMMASLLLVTILGTFFAGGPLAVWEKSVEMKRIQFFNFDSSPFIRHTVWAVLIGSCLSSTAYITVNQTMVQRYQSFSTIKLCKQAIGWFTVGTVLFISLCCWCGLVFLAWWAAPKCDPRATGLIVSDEHLLPTFIMETMSEIPGIPGLFIAGIFGTALSSLSIRLNSLSIILLEDFVKISFSPKPNDKWATNFVKIVVAVFSLVTLGLMFLIEKLGVILSVTTFNSPPGPDLSLMKPGAKNDDARLRDFKMQILINLVTNSLAVVTVGVTFGVFSLGILCPWTNSKGAFVGAVIGFILSGWASLGANIAIDSGHIPPKKLHVPLKHCAVNVTESFLKQFKHHNDDHIFPPYRLSYHWFSPLGTVIVVLIGGIITWMTGALDPSSLDKNLFSPVIHRWIPKSKLSNEVCNWRHQSKVSSIGLTSSVPFKGIRKTFDR